MESLGEDELNVVIGEGMIGKALYYHLRKFGGTRLLGRKELDVVKPYDVPEGDVFYLCFGRTRTQDCEGNPAETYAINVDGTLKLAERLKGHVIWISSERVFDGCQAYRMVEDNTCPTTEYGKQKSITEHFLIEQGHTVVRFAKVLGYDVPMFDKWVEDLRNDVKVHPYSNMSMSPVSINFVVDVLRRIGNARLKGVYQVSGDKDITYDRVCRHIANYLGYNMGLVQPVSAPVPHPFTTLVSNLRIIGVDTPSSWEAIYGWCHEVRS